MIVGGAGGSGSGGGVGGGGGGASVGGSTIEREKPSKPHKQKKFNHRHMKFYLGHAIGRLDARKFCERIRSNLNPNFGIIGPSNLSTLTSSGSLSLPSPSTSGDNKRNNNNNNNNNNPNERYFVDKMKSEEISQLLAAGFTHLAYSGWSSFNVAAASKLSSSPETFFLLCDNEHSFEYGDVDDSTLNTNNSPTSARRYTVSEGDGSCGGVEIGRGRSRAPSVYFLSNKWSGKCVLNAGFLAGWCQEILRMEVVAVEVKCKGCGDEVCRFLVAPKTMIRKHILNYFHPTEKKRRAFLQKREGGLWSDPLAGVAPASGAASNSKQDRRDREWQHARPGLPRLILDEEKDKRRHWFLEKRSFFNRSNIHNISPKKVDPSLGGVLVKDYFTMLRKKASPRSGKGRGGAGGEESASGGGKGGGGGGKKGKKAKKDNPFGEIQEYCRAEYGWSIEDMMCNRLNGTITLSEKQGNKKRLTSLLPPMVCTHKTTHIF